MRFWITKNSELPIHEQLVRQVMLAILSDDLPAGRKLPSTRALARRYKIHANTVSAAYHDLLDRGWLELRRGSGLYVRALQAPRTEASELDVMLAELLRAARGQGHAPEEVLHRLEQLILPRRCERVAVIEADPHMREILQAELGELLGVPIDAVEPSDLAEASTAYLATALPTRAVAVREQLARSIPFLVLRLRSVHGSLERETKPASEAIISVASKSAEFREGARAMLIAVGLDPESLCEIDANLDGWHERAHGSSLVIADVVAARSLPAARPVKVFRIIADSCLEEIQELCARPEKTK